MIDSYLIGAVDRISPEAPVPIISVTNNEYRLGGAANVALNIKALEANPIICTVIGDDENGKIFLNLLEKLNISKEHTIISRERKTTSKTRIISNGQHLLRVDNEINTELSSVDENLLTNNILQSINNNNIDVIIFEDYDKGVITKTLIDKITKIANSKNIFTTVDPKKRNFLHYKNTTLFKPNLKELSEGLMININKENKEEIFNAVKTIHNKLNSKITFLTLSELGCYILNQETSNYLPAEIRQIADVSGAGDTVISVASLCLTENMDIKDIAYISNIAGGLVCENVGVVSINKQQLKNEILKNTNQSNYWQTMNYKNKQKIHI